MHISRQRCYNHAGREAAARCPQCGRFFCRECVAEYGRRFLCAACLAEMARVGKRPGIFWAGPRAVLKLFTAVLLLWACFHFSGQMLMQAPDFFHEAASGFFGDFEE